MPSALTYPGVYIEEVPSGVRTIAAVSTSVAAFVGFLKRGSTQVAIQCFNFSDFMREFGGLDFECEVSYAVQQFFLNGGAEAWVVRTSAVGSSTAAAISLKALTSSANPLVKVVAASEGEWSNNVRLVVDYDTPTPTQSFNLTVAEMVTSGGQLVPGKVEVFRNLIIDPSKSNDAKKVVNNGSKLVQLDYESPLTPGQRPAHSGTVSKKLTPADLGAVVANDGMKVSLNGVALAAPLVLKAPLPTTLAGLAAAMTAALRPLDGKLKNATVNLLGSASTQQYLHVSAGNDATSAADDLIEFTPADALATKLGFTADSGNVRQYSAGGLAKASQALPGAAQVKGANGNPPTAADIAGDPLAKTGLYRLDAVDLFNLLCIPDTVSLPDAQAADVASKAAAYCEVRRAFYILDIPQKDAVRDEVSEVKTWLDVNATLRHKNAATYFPRPSIADPLNDFRPRVIAPSGLLAGLYARTDTERGVWKAPAGTEATLRGVQALETTLTDAENGTLNPKAINCLRRFPVYGNVSWGARTLVGADAQASEWKYIPVRRTALFIEESLYRGTQWVVFEPNDEPLWAQIRLNVGAFMHTLFRQGAFQGTSPRDAYLVKCDSETTTQTDINSGIVNIVVGFAPLKPAEFVIIKLQQLAGQIET
ncbi:MAG: phage tail sheath C-terminal domain-containing protein [Opitutus sp.]